ncbi:MAG TPA: YhcH/YjgK/YiaL family protein [Planctomycetaceae bacterium]|nr:YhcH/YjgK/YiaL family protein [Planctomycetaceae bacterium]
MILEALSRADRCAALSPGIAAALRYLQSVDLTALPDGKVEIDGPRLIANVARYQTKRPDQAVWESHRKYIDVQYVVTGVERIGYVPLENAPPVQSPYNDAKDVIFYEPGCDSFTLRAGQFAVFYPEDIHAPSLADGEPSPVLKVVMKVLIEG